jgi:hypothetical protein
MQHLLTNFPNSNGKTLKQQTFLPYSIIINIFACKTTKDYGTWKLLGQKRRPDWRGKDCQTLGRERQQRRQTLPRPQRNARIRKHPSAEDYGYKKGCLK